MVENVATLRGATHDGPATTIARGASGTFFLFDAADRRVKVFGKDGRLLRTIGKRGGGPGEYELVRNLLVGTDGHLTIIDGSLGRRSEFEPNGTFIRSTPIPVQGGMGMSAVLLPDGQLIVNSLLRGERDAGFALQRLNLVGVRTALVDESDFDFRKKWLQHRALWIQPNGDLFVVRPYSFTIDIYSKDLRKRASITRVADWLPSVLPRNHPGDGVFNEPYTPRLRAVWLDAAGLLWLHIMLPSQAWKAVDPPRAGRPPSDDSIAALASRARIETIVEAIDLSQRRVVARLRINGSLGLPFGGGYFSMAVEDSVGEPSVEIRRVDLRR